MRRVVFKVRVLWFVAFALVAGVWPMAAQAAAVPGTADSFAVLAGKALTCTRTSVTGAVGVNFPVTATVPTLTGTACPQRARVQFADTAYADFLSQYKTGLGSPCITSPALTTPLPAGTYCFPAALTFVTGGTLNLTGTTGPWNFEIGTALSGTTFTVNMVDGGNPCNVFWWVGQDVSFTDVVFKGTILAGGDISFTRTNLTGRAWAGGTSTPALPAGAVTMTDSNILGCTAAGTVPVTKCKKGGDNDEDKDADKSKDAADRNESVKGATAGASNSSHDDGKKGCDSGKSDKDKSDNDSKNRSK